jgi:ATP-dependent RNA helicase DeaD
LNNFQKLGLSETLSTVLDKIGFTDPTPIQTQAIPLLLTNDPTDFIGLAQTGTGKTAAFGLPLIDLIDSSNRKTQALILCPTRELSQQTATQLKSFAVNHDGLNIEVVYGGASIVPQMKALKKPTQLIVATPGRLLDLIKRKSIDLSSVRYIVLDEADEMLNMGFQEDIDLILSYAEEKKSTWLFSATMPNEVRKIVKNYMANPAEIKINAGEKSNKDISHQYIVTKSTDKLSALRRFLDLQPEMRGVLFCRTKRETQEIADQLGHLGYGVEALHGDLSQAQRDSVMKRFKARSMQLLIATDVAARGIDVQDLSHVMHHTLPDQLESYTHRSGRTGRAGKKGISLAFINGREAGKIRQLEKMLSIKFELKEVPTVDQLKSSRIQNWSHLILNTKVAQEAEVIWESLHEDLAHLTREELMKRWITTQLDHIEINQNESADLNFRGGKEDTRSSQRGSSSDGSRYFVNLGSMDGLTEADLIHLLSDLSDVDRKYFKNLRLQKNHSFFDVSDKQDKGMMAKFEGCQVQGRDIRVNRDDEQPSKKSSGRSFNSSFSKGKPKPNRGRAPQQGRRRGRR